MSGSKTLKLFPSLMKIFVQQPIFIGHNFNKTGEF